MRVCAESTTYEHETDRKLHGEGLNVAVNEERSTVDGNDDAFLHGFRYDLTESSSDEDSSSSSSSSEECFESESSSEEYSESSKSSSDSERSDKSDNEQVINSDSDSDDAFTPQVFEGCALTVDEGVLELMNLFVKHKMEKIVIGDVLKGLLRFCPKVHNMPKSQHLLFKYVKDLVPLPPENVHYYCADCLYYIGSDPTKCPVCEGEVSRKFFHLSLAAQLKNFFENHGLADKLDKHSVLRQATCQDYEVIYDLWL